MSYHSNQNHGKMQQVITTGGNIDIVDFDSFLGAVMKGKTLQEISDSMADIELLDVEDDGKDHVFNISCPKTEIDTVFEGYGVNSSSSWEEVRIELPVIQNDPTEEFKKQILDQAVEVKLGDSVKFDSQDANSLAEITECLSVHSLENFNMPTHLVHLGGGEFIIATLEDLEIKTAIRDKQLRAGIICKRRSIYKTKVDVVR